MESGRPHWIIVDEAHHLLPASLQRAGEMLPKRVGSLVMVTVHPDWVNREALESVGDSAHAGEGRGGRRSPRSRPRSARTCPTRPGRRAERGTGRRVVPVPRASRPSRSHPLEPSGERRRHLRKYAEGDLEEDAFYFRGPDDKLNLRVQNLVLFAQIADGIDDETLGLPPRNAGTTSGGSERRSATTSSAPRGVGRRRGRRRGASHDHRRDRGAVHRPGLSDQTPTSAGAPAIAATTIGRTTSSVAPDLSARSAQATRSWIATSSSRENRRAWSR